VITKYGSGAARLLTLDFAVQSELALQYKVKERGGS
jgi:hypothetical protein